MNKSIFLVEDENEIRELMELHLRRNGFEVESSGDGQEALNQVLNKSYDLIILDWMLPGYSGLEITKEIRDHQIKTPILFVTAKSDSMSLVQGLQSGADDYLTKPFEIEIFLARVKALLRRKNWMDKKQGEETFYKAGPLELFPDAFEAYLDRVKLDLTKSEFRLLHTLFMNQGRVLTRDELIQDVQGEGVNVTGRTVDTHVFGLRKKLGEHGNLIETIRGVGYRISFKDQSF